jgi:hypothetical protein
MTLSNGRETLRTPESLWEANLKLASEVEAMPASSSSKVILKMIPASRRLRPKCPRRMGQIDPKLLGIIRRLCLGDSPWPLFLFGHAGSGKTSAALCVCDIAATACFFEPEQVVDGVIAGDPPWDAIRQKDLAVLDEIGARERVSDVHYRAVKQFADEREIHANRVAIYVSNISPDVLVDLYDDRVASRLLCGSIFKTSDKDRRVGR